MAQISIGKLTREAAKTDERNVFFWRERKLRLLFDAGLRDRLIDDESGLYATLYHREGRSTKVNVCAREKREEDRARWRVTCHV